MPPELRDIVMEYLESILLYERKKLMHIELWLTCLERKRERRYRLLAWFRGPTFMLF